MGFGHTPPGEGRGVSGASGGPDGPTPPSRDPFTAPSAGETTPPHIDARSPFRQNWFALASFATLLVLTPAGIFATGNPTVVITTTVVGVVFAQFALAASKKAGRPLRKTSIWAMVLNFVMVPGWMVLYVAVATYLGWEV